MVASRCCSVSSKDAGVGQGWGQAKDVGVGHDWGQAVAAFAHPANLSVYWSFFFFLRGSDSSRD